MVYERNVHHFRKSKEDKKNLKLDGNMDADPVIHSMYPICGTRIGWLYCKKTDSSKEVN